MFTMTLRWKLGDLIAQGDSNPGEDWKGCLLRLHHQATGNKDVSSDVELVQEEDEKGTGNGLVLLTHKAGGPTGMTHAKEQIRVETDPPQF